MTTTKKKISNTSIRNAAHAKGVQTIASAACPHCAIIFNKVGQHINICMMNPERKAQGGSKMCPKCYISSTAKNFERHVEKCVGDAELTIDKALQSYRAEYLRIMRGGKPVDSIDRSLGYGHRAVPEIFRKNVENDLLDRGMPSDWSISATLRIVKPVEEMPTEIIETKNEHQVIDDDYALAIGSVVNLITDERTMAEVLNHIINLATYKLATR